MTSTIPPAGEEASFPLSEELTVRHGSSLSLMSNVCEFLANPVQEDTFNYVDPTADHQKWARKGLTLYYASVTNTKDGSVVCALRAATESNASNRPPIFLIDYIYSAPSHRDQGIAGKLIGQVLAMAREQIKFVLSIEESCVYWMEKHGFFLCQQEAINKRLNVFPDTHLLIHKDSQKDMETLAQEDCKSASTSPVPNASPPESFTTSLTQLQIFGASQPGLALCCQTLATLLKNAKDDESDDGKRQTIKINNPQVHRRIFSVGGEPAMKLLQVCGFELQVNGDGDAILKFEGEDLGWLDAAIAQLEALGA